MKIVDCYNIGTSNKLSHSLTQKQRHVIVDRMRAFIEYHHIYETINDIGKHRNSNKCTFSLLDHEMKEPVTVFNICLFDNNTSALT